MDVRHHLEIIILCQGVDPAKTEFQILKQPLGYYVRMLHIDTGRQPIGAYGDLLLLQLAGRRHCARSGTGGSQTATCAQICL